MTYGDFALITFSGAPGNYLVYPNDLAAHEDYEFKLDLQVGADSFKTSKLILDVGCKNAVVTDSTSLNAALRIKDILIDTAPAGLFEFINPTIDLAYCLITNNYLSDKSVDGVSDTSIASWNGCSPLPCFAIDLASTATVQIIKWKVSTTITGGKIHKTRWYYKATIVCDSSTL